MRTTLASSICSKHLGPWIRWRSGSQTSGRRGTGPVVEGDAEGDLAACRSRDALPICLVALSESGDVLGTASLRSESVGSELGVGPWLAAVLVPREHQGQGVGTALVAAIEAEARRLGFECLYTSTSTAEGLLKRRGWEAFGASQSLRGPVAVYRRGSG